MALPNSASLLRCGIRIKVEKWVRHPSRYLIKGKHYLQNSSILLIMISI